MENLELKSRTYLTVKGVVSKIWNLIKLVHAWKVVASQRNGAMQGFVAQYW